MFKKSEVPHDLPRISICMAGAPRSGKSSFIRSIYYALMAYALHIDNKSISLRVTKISNGVEEKDLVNYNSKPKTVADDIFEGTAATSGETDYRAVEMDAKIGATDFQRIIDEFKNLFDIDGVLKGTDRRTFIELEFTILINGAERCVLSICDFAGEIFNDARHIPDAILNTYYIKILDSEAMMVLVSGTELDGNIQLGHGENILNNAVMNDIGGNHINNLVQECGLRLKENEPYTVLITITKKDSPNARNVRNNYEQLVRSLIMKTLSNSIEQIRNHRWSNGIMHISAYGENSVDGNDMLINPKDYNPENIDNAMLFCIFNACLQKRKELEESRRGVTSREKKILEAQINDLTEIINCIIPKIQEINDQLYHSTDGVLKTPHYELYSSERPRRGLFG